MIVMLLNQLAVVLLSSYQLVFDALQLCCIARLCHGLSSVVCRPSVCNECIGAKPWVV